MTYPALHDCLPCDSHEVHLDYIPALRKTAQELSSGTEPTPGACVRAFTWMAKYPSPASCPRVLLKIREVLKTAGPRFSSAYGDHYPIAYGRLIGTLIERYAEDPVLKGDPTAVNVQRSLWDELSKPFISAPSWKARRQLLDTAKEALHQISSCGAHDRFWRTLSLYATYLAAAYGNPISPDGELCSAGRIYLDILSTLFHRKAPYAGVAGPNPRNAADALMLARANKLALLLAVRTTDDLIKWATTTAAVRELLDGWKHVDITTEFERTADELHRHAYACCDESLRGAFGDALRIAMPALHGRPAAELRRNPLPGDSHCSITFSNGISVQGEVINICGKSYRGFAVETMQATATDASREITVVSGTMIDNGQVQALARPETFRPDTAVLTLNLTGTQMSPRFGNCTVLRQWPLDRSRSGVGVALLDHDSGYDNSWKDYVDALANNGRYNPELTQVG